MKYQKVRKVISFISSLSLVFQSFTPLAIAMPVYAEDATNSAIIEVTPTPEITPEVTPEATPTVEITPEITPDPTPTAEVTPDITPTPTVEVTPTPEITPEVTPEATPTVDPTPTEIQNNSPPAEETPNQPTVTTDKADYAPTDTVQIAGMFFLANTPYTSTVTSETDNYSNVENVVTDELGSFMYFLPLLGEYRPDYAIAVTDSTNEVVASTTFTDGNVKPPVDVTACNYNCTANDINSIKFELVKADGTALSCSYGTTTSAYIKVTYNNQTSGRYAAYILGEIWQGGTKIKDINAQNACLDTMVSGTNTYIFNPDFTWTCGESVEIKNLIIAWNTSATNCSEFFAQDSCPPPAQSFCGGSVGYVVTTPLVSDFSATSACKGVSTSYNSTTSGGTTPYSYSWTFGDGGTSTLEDPSHAFATAGTFSSSLSVTDNSSPTQTKVVTKNVTVNDCAICGDGDVNQDSEVCDDGNTVNGDHCSSTCQIEEWCGDTIVNGSEQCEGSSSTSCTARGYAGTKSCIASSCNWGTCSPTESCGDNIKNGNEQCDGTDGVPTHYTCDTSCQLQYVPYCGDGIVNQTSESCDDNNSTNGDGCSSSCQVEKGSITACKYNDQNRNGTRETNENLIYWTFGLDGNNFYATTDGCITFSNIDLNVEKTVYENSDNGWASFNATTQKVTLTNTDQNKTIYFGNYEINKCGDGYLDSGEVCDGDAPIACSTDEGYTGTQSCGSVTCTWDSCQTTEYCGDGIKNGREECDGTSGVSSGYSCSTSCTLNRDTGNIVINKIIDVDGDPLTISDQTPGQNWEFDVKGNSTGTTDVLGLFTNNLGTIGTGTINSGEYNIREYVQDGYDLVAAYCNNQTGSLDGNTIYSASFIKDETLTCTFINTPTGKVHGYKWDDLDGDGSIDEGEDKLSDWTIKLYRMNSSEQFELIDTMLTDSGQTHFGWFWFEHLIPGYYKVCEVTQSGWNQTYPNDPECHTMTLPDENSSGFFESLNAIYGPEYNFGNIRIDPTLTISRSNNASSALNPGSSVEHTITIKVQNNDVTGLTLIDLLPNGFKFRTGSYSVFKGTDDITGSISAPVYNSPGEWTLGNFAEDDVITIKYLADISSDVLPGLYDDLAYAYANQGSVYADGEDSEYVSGNFVGTDVEVVKDLTNEETYSVEKRVEGQVLGATTLPATGASPIWMLIAMLGFVYGFRLIKSSNKK